MAQLPALDDFPYVGQEEDSLACVPACIEMICEFLGIQKERADIEDELGFSVDIGTPFGNVRLLSQVRAFSVASVKDAVNELERGLPVIAHLRIANAAVLGYSAEGAFLHAVVLVGADLNSVILFDPLSQVLLSTTSPTCCPRAVFEDAWLEGYVLTPGY